MNKKLKTTIEFTKNLFTTGAFSETSRDVEIEICQYISDQPNQVIVEYGMGHGNITREILNRISPNSKVYAFEVKKEFCDHVAKELNDDRLIIVNDGAENMKNHVKEEIHSVIGSIPFSFFSKEKGLAILQDSYDQLVNEGFYSQVLYTKFNFKKFLQVFDDCEMKKLKNFPTEYIYHCQKKK